MCIVFLFLYSYILLSNYYSPNNMVFAYLSVVSGITVFEIILCVWRFSYICIMLQPKRFKKFKRNFKHFNLAKFIQVSFLTWLKNS